MKTKHVNRYPAAPTADQQADYEWNLGYEHMRLGLHYRTGPRRGQQLALARELARVEAS